MNHEEAMAYFDALGEGVPDRRPPVGDLIRSGQRARRRRNRVHGAVLASVAASVVAGGVVVQQWTSHDSTGVDHTPAGPPDAPSTAPLPGEASVGNGPCPPIPASGRLDPTTVPAPNDAEGLTASASGGVAAWFEPASGSLPFLVVFDTSAQKELAREDLGVGEDLRSSSLRVDETALYYRSSADADVWVRYRWGLDDYPAVFVTCG